MSFSALINRLDGAVMQHLSDGTCSYQGVSFLSENAGYILDQDHEVYDDNQVAQRVTTVCIEVKHLPSASRIGDQIITAGRTWKVQQTLEDDGHLRRLYVT